jgi:Asp-tRNA(Asn)/Glu-tRNA(Gln) amidotransferase A subunit family amidase
VIFGKTVTTEFAWREPGPTVNPWNRLHTPGGSSSGSAAAVAAGIVPLHTLIAAGAATPAAEYEAAVALQARLRRESKPLLARCDALVTLSAPGEAPARLSDTGDGIFCAPWSLTGSPVVTVPSGRTANGLPLAFQVVGEFGADLRTLQIAAWVESQLEAQWPALCVSAGYPEAASA